MAGRIVLDVSTSFAWGRPPVGIVRTEQEFAAFLLEQAGLDVAFCRFDRPSRRHVEVPRDAVARLLSAADDRDSPSVPVEERPSFPPRDRRLRGSVARAAERGIERLPRALRDDASSVVRGGEIFLKGMYWLARRAWREALAPRGRAQGASERAQTSSASRPELQPGRDDVYVSMGLDWRYNDLDALGSLKKRCGFRTLLHCYDLVPIRYPHFVPLDGDLAYAKYFRDLARVADQVVAISHATADDYRDFLAEVGAHIPPMSVVHLGTDIAVRAARGNEAPPSDLPQGPFVLCVGTIEPRKNHELLHNVWDRLVTRYGDRVPRLVLVGLVGWGVDDLLVRIRLNPRVADKIVILQDVPDEGLLWLYRHCRFTVFPSFFEGWGLPVVESLALGKPCLASNARAVIEATGGLVPALDPLNFAAWVGHIERWIFDDEALETAARRLGGYRPQSWRDHGEGMLAVIRRMSGTALPASV